MKMLGFPKSTAWPRMIVSTPTYIGFRTYRYKPVTTRCLVGKIGAGVPTP